MTREQVRNLAFALLKDEHGIGQVAFDLLWELLKQHGCEDILQVAKAIDGRFYLPE